MSSTSISAHTASTIGPGSARNAGSEAYASRCARARPRLPTPASGASPGARTSAKVFSSSPQFPRDLPRSERPDDPSSIFTLFKKTEFGRSVDMSGSNPQLFSAAPEIRSVSLYHPSRAGK